MLPDIVKEGQTKVVYIWRSESIGTVNQLAFMRMNQVSWNRLSTFFD